MFDALESKMTLCAFRYCIWRETYIVDDFEMWMGLHVQDVPTKYLEIIVKEIVEAKTASENGTLRLPCLSTWSNIEKLIRKELGRRGD